jgi:hypothetical protein
MDSATAQSVVKRDKFQTSMAATFAVASELSRRGYNVGLTVGNTPKVDLICSVPDGKAFKIQVKGLSSENDVYIQWKFFSEPAQEDLFLIVVVVPPVSEPYKFFVLTHAQAIEEWKEGYTEGTIEQWKRYQIKNNSPDGLRWKNIKRYPDKWEVLPKLS